MTFLKYISTFQQLLLIYSSADVCCNVMLPMLRLLNVKLLSLLLLACHIANCMKPPGMLWHVNSFWDAMMPGHNGCGTTVFDGY